MGDPYKVLGVSRNASDDDIKKAYRELARKYHPDNYANNPLADLAQEKMKEINEAYDQITKERSGGGSSSYGRGGASSYGGSEGYSGANAAAYASIRQQIVSGNITGAEERLNAMGTQDAEWHFLMGNVCQRKGWYDEAYRHFQMACSMNPSNMEYRNAMAQMGGMNTTYRTYGGGMSSMDCCTSMLCADLCCSCTGGGC